jgi:hypothetical protein
MTASGEKTYLTFKRREGQTYRTSDTGCNRYFLPFQIFSVFDAASCLPTILLNDRTGVVFGGASASTDRERLRIMTGV